MNTRKVVVNRCYGGFGISRVALEELRKLKNKHAEDATEFRLGVHIDIPRDDEHLVDVVERLGASASGEFAELEVVCIPEDVDWTIEEYDGREWVTEKHRTW